MSIHDPGTITGTDHPVTSHLAAERVLPHTGTQRFRVLRSLYYALPGGLTDEEMVQELEMNPNTQRPRRVELVDGGWVRDSGNRRNTRSGSRAIVWVFQA